MIHYPLNTLKVSFTYTVGGNEGTTTIILTLVNSPSIWRQSLDIPTHPGQCHSRTRQKAQLINRCQARMPRSNGRSGMALRELSSNLNVRKRTIKKRSPSRFQKCLTFLQKCFTNHLAEISRCQRKCRQSNYLPAQSAWCLFTDKSGLHSAMNQLCMLLIIEQRYC